MKTLLFAAAVALLCSPLTAQPQVNYDTLGAEECDPNIHPADSYTTHNMSGDENAEYETDDEPCHGATDGQLRPGKCEGCDGIVCWTIRTGRVSNASATCFPSGTISAAGNSCVSGPGYVHCQRVSDTGQVTGDYERHCATDEGADEVEPFAGGDYSYEEWREIEDARRDFAFEMEFLNRRR